ncbi:MAG: hypothetical protein WCA84_17475 [Ignavibacteriaceae bacterium]
MKKSIIKLTPMGSNRDYRRWRDTQTLNAGATLNIICVTSVNNLFFEGAGY